MHRPSPFLQPLQKNTYHLPCLPLPLHRPLHFYNLLKSTSIASPRTTTLASLVKGRWIDGKAQALILLLSACDMPTIFMLQTFCRQDGGIAQQPFAPHNLPNTHYPTLSTTFLPPLSKVRCCRPKKFGRLPEGLPHHHPSLAPTLPKPHYPPRFS